MLEQRLALSPEIRAAQTLSSKVEAMKVFLGVLNDDVVRIDVGLAEASGIQLDHCNHVLKVPRCF